LIVLQGTSPDVAAVERDAGWSVRIRLIHWSTALAVATQLLIGFFLLGGAAMVTSPWLAVHLSLGLATLGCRLLDSAPKHVGPRALEIVAALGHFSLYALLILVPITGWLGYRPGPFQTPPHFFGVFQMPVISGLSPIAPRTMLAIHSLASWTLLALIGVHVAAAMFHAIVLKDGVPQSMLFRAKRSA
jgi:cytochrome b561